MRRILVALGLAGTALLSCAELPQIPQATCGNSVVEQGEECDRFGRDGFACRLGDPKLGGCRLECSTDERCPTGFGCGRDGLCHRPSGEFEETPVRIVVDARRVELADFDGDKRLDPVAQTTVEMRVHYFDGRFEPTRVTAVRGNIHRLSHLGANPALATLATGSNSALSVWRGQPDRTLAATLYPALAIGAGIVESRVFVANAFTTPPTGVADELLFVSSTDGASARVDLDIVDVQSLSLIDWTAPPSSVAGPAFGRSWTARPCDLMTWAYPGFKELNAFALCDFFGQPSMTRTPSAKIKTLNPVRSVVAARVDNDALVDLVVQPSLSAPLEVAFGGFAAFSSTSGGVPDNQTAVAPWPAGKTVSASGSLLAAGDIDGDGFIDVVDSKGITLSTGAPFVTTALKSAVIQDANRDGFLDVIAIGPYGSFFVVGTGKPLLNPSFTPLDGTPTHMIVADFDGDLVDDVLVGSSIDDATSRLTIQWGRALQLPEAPRVVGVIPTIKDMAGGALAPRLLQAPTTIAIAPIITDHVGQIEAPILYGATTRVLESPLNIVKTVEGTTFRGAIANIVTGHFASADRESVALLTYDVGALATPRLWFASVTGDAAMDPSGLARAPSTLPIATPKALSEAERWWDGSLGVAVDLDGDALDELVLLVPPDANDGKGALLTARLTKDSPFEGVTTVPFGVANATTTIPWSLQKSDVDGDGTPDLLALYTGEAGVRCKVILNRGGGAVAIGAAIDVPLPDRGTVMSVAPVRVSATGAGRSLLLATEQALYLAEWDGRAFSAPRSLGEAGSASTMKPPSMVAGDVDGDGLDDVVIARENAVYVFFQKELEP